MKRWFYDTRKRIAEGGGDGAPDWVRIALVLGVIVYIFVVWLNSQGG